MADGNDVDFLEPQFQKSIEEVKEDIRKEIRKELKLKEGAENLRKVIPDYHHAVCVAHPRDAYHRLKSKRGIICIIYNYDNIYAYYVYNNIFVLPS